MLKTLFLHQYLQDLGLDNLLSKNVPNFYFFIFQIWGPPLHWGRGQIVPSAPPPSDMPCKLIIFPIEKSLHEFFF